MVNIVVVAVGVVHVVEKSETTIEDVGGVQRLVETDVAELAVVEDKTCAVFVVARVVAELDMDPIVVDAEGCVMLLVVEIAVDDNVTVLDDVAADVVAYAADPLGIAVGVDLDEAFVKPDDDEEAAAVALMLDVMVENDDAFVE